MDQPLNKYDLNSKRLRVLIKSTLWLTLLLCGFLSLRQLISPTLIRDELRTSQVTRGKMESSLSASGKVVPKYEEIVTAEITARVLEVLSHPGEAVKEGQVLLKLDTRQVEIELQSLVEKIAVKDNLTQSKKLQTRKNSNDIQSKINLLKIDLEGHKGRFDRLQILVKSGATSKQELLEAELGLKRVSLEIDQLKISLKDTIENSDTEVAGILLEKSILDKEKQEKIRLIESASVKAPRAGILTWIKEEEGSRILPGDSLVRIADLTVFKVEASISDFYSRQISKGQNVNIKQAENTLKGKINTVSPTIEEGIVNFIVELDTPSAKSLRANLRVDVEIITDVIENTLMVKQGPFVSGKGIHEVFVINGDTATKKWVEIGVNNSDYLQVIKGLNKGDEVIISNMNDYLAMRKINVN